MMKAIGATRGTVFRSFLTTSALIGLIGAGIGAGLGIVVAYLVERTLMRQSFGFDAGFAVDWPTVVLSLAVGVGVVVLASLPALFRTLRVSVVEGLESHGISADYGHTFLDRTLMRVRGIPRVVQMGIRNAARRKGRSISTILQVAFAVAVVIAMLNGADGLIDMTVRAYDPWTWDLRTTVADKPGDPMTVGKAARVDGIEGVESAEPFYGTVAKINDRTVSFYGYVQATRALDTETTLAKDGHGRWWTPDEAAAAARVVVVGEALSRFESIELGDTVELMTATGAHEFEVIGIDTGLPENGLFGYAPLEAVQAILQKGDGVNGFFIQTTSSQHGEIDATSRRISGELEALGYQADITAKYVAAEQNVTQNQALTGMFLMMSFIVVLIVLIGLMSTLVMNILDRTKEIGMLRCIGAQSRDVRLVFSSEGLFLALLGWIVGLPLGYVVFQVYVAAMAIGMKLTMPDKYALAYVGLSLVFTLVGALVVIFFPLRRATGMRPGDAIRYE
jgi:putative ABC transport system permease protein